MASLLEELREHEANYPALIHGPLCGKAADTIDAVNAMLVDQQGEIERLRAVLKRLTKDPPATLARTPDEDWEVIKKMRAIARAALDHNQTGERE